TRAFFEPRFGYNFSDVRVHSGLRANTSARALNAQAYTFGREIVFANGMYPPSSETDRRLLAHELTHVAQQCGPCATASISEALRPSQAVAASSFLQRQVTDVDEATGQTTDEVSDGGLPASSDGGLPASTDGGLPASADGNLAATPTPGSPAGSTTKCS